jgi:hypothetical protein
MKCPESKLQLTSMPPPSNGRRVKCPDPTLECPALSLAILKERQVCHHVITHKVLLARLEP